MVGMYAIAIFNFLEVWELLQSQLAIATAIAIEENVP